MTNVTGVILAGGQGRRMEGEDKGLVAFHGRPLIESVVLRLRPQVDSLVISANRNLDRYTAWTTRVVRDAEEHANAGPLAGVLAALHVATTEYVVVLPCDAPALPLDLVTRLRRACIGRDASYAHDGTQPQFAVLCCRVDVARELDKFLGRGERRVEHWLARLGALPVDFSDQPAAFANLNSPDDLRAAEKNV